MHAALLAIATAALAAPAGAFAPAKPAARRSPTAVAAVPWVRAGAAAAAASAAGLVARRVLDRPARPYTEPDSVGDEYDAWTTDGILEAYWGEHIHLGYYTKEELAAGYKKKDFIEAKYEFIRQQAKWGGLMDGAPPKTILDVGCGIGGTSRFLAAEFGPGTKVNGITLSKEQVKRGMQLAKERGLDNVDLNVMNALEMDYADDSFDVVWAIESGEHMPDKKKYVEEMTRVLKPGGTLVFATWCQRDSKGNPLTPKEERDLDFLYSEWRHPYFISINDYADLMRGTGQLEQVGSDNWNEQTIASWRHSIWVGVWNPWPVVRRPLAWYKTVRDGICLERMHRAFDRELMQYGMLKAVKKQAAAPAPPAAAEDADGAPVTPDVGL